MDAFLKLLINVPSPIECLIFLLVSDKFFCIEMVHFQANFSVNQNTKISPTHAPGKDFHVPRSSHSQNGLGGKSLKTLTMAVFV